MCGVNDGAEGGGRGKEGDLKAVRRLCSHPFSKQFKNENICTERERESGRASGRSPVPLRLFYLCKAKQIEGGRCRLVE